MTPSVSLRPDTSGSMRRYRDFVIGDVHGGTDVAAGITAMLGKFPPPSKPVVFIVTDGDPFNYKKVTRVRKARAGVNQYVQQLRHRGSRKMRERRTVLKSTDRWYY